MEEWLVREVEERERTERREREEEQRREREVWGMLLNDPRARALQAALEAEEDEEAALQAEIEDIRQEL